MLLSRQTKYTLEQNEDSAVIRVKNTLSNSESVYNLVLKEAVGLGNSGIVKIDATADIEKIASEVDFVFCIPFINECFSGKVLAESFVTAFF